MVPLCQRFSKLFLIKRASLLHANGTNLLFIFKTVVEILIAVVAIVLLKNYNFFTSLMHQNKLERLHEGSTFTMSYASQD
jgi:hypothetical protein